MKWGPREGLSRRTSRRDAAEEAAMQARRKIVEADRDSARAIHQTSVEMLERMSAALTRRNASPR